MPARFTALPAYRVSRPGYFYRDLVLRETGLLYYWPLDEPSGTPLDLVGGKNLSITGTVTQGQAGVVPGSTAYEFGGGMCTVTPGAALNTTWSVECVVRMPSSLPAGINRAFWGNNYSNYWSAQQLYDASGVRWHGDTGNGSSWMANNTGDDKLATQPVASEWFHHVFAVNGTSWAQYINGVLNDSGTYASSAPRLFTASSAGSVFGIGGRTTGDSTTNRWNGSLQHVAVYDVKLSAEVAASHAAAATLAQPSSRIYRGTSRW